MKNIILLTVIVVTVGFAAFYIIKEKKSGTHCIGCPYTSVCSQKYRSLENADKKRDISFSGVKKKNM